MDWKHALEACLLPRESERHAGREVEALSAWKVRGCGGLALSLVSDHNIRSYCAGSENRRASVWRSATGSAKVSLNTVRTIQHAVSWVVVDG